VVESKTPHGAVVRQAVFERNPAWAQLLGLCPLLAVSTSVANAVGLAIASGFVVVGSNVAISALRKAIPDFARLPCFVLIIATFTTLTVMWLEAYAFGLYTKIALFVQIIVTNCMILGRAEAFASRQPISLALLDAFGTAVGFAIALLALGTVREVVGHGTLFAGFEHLFGDTARAWSITLADGEPLRLAQFAPGAFLIAGLMFAFANALRSPASNETNPSANNP
jgi:electron transport complex protein RnfE